MTVNYYSMLCTMNAGTSSVVVCYSQPSKKLVSRSVVTAGCASEDSVEENGGKTYPEQGIEIKPDVIFALVEGKTLRNAAARV